MLHISSRLLIRRNFRYTLTYPNVFSRGDLQDLNTKNNTCPVPLHYSPCDKFACVNYWIDEWHGVPVRDSASAHNCCGVDAGMWGFHHRQDINPCLLSYVGQTDRYVFT